MKPSLAMGVISCATAAMNASVQSAPFYIQWTDPADDQVLRETGSVGAGQINTTALPDMLSLTFTAWQATDPVTDPYTGQAVDPASAHLVRFDLVFNGLCNPPGPLALAGSPYDPYEFGDRPVYGFIEIDVDDDMDSGGELETAALFRYLANVGRFGGLPTGAIGDRAALSADDYDGSFFDGPQFERSGADMTLVMCGCFDPTLVQEIGDGDGVMQAGETMIVRGRFFERFQALAPYSGDFGGSDFGAYDPLVNLRFQHDVQTDTTTVSLVFPLDAQGAADLTGQPAQPLDFNLNNHTSVAELLRDIILTSSGCCGPIFNDAVVLQLAQNWISPNFPNVALIEQELTQYLDPTTWKASAILGAPYATQQTALYVWTDLGFQWTFADLNHDGLVTTDDETIFNIALNNLDGTSSDADGAINGVVIIQNFGINFSLYDLNGDGVINTNDADLINTAPPADLNGDGLINGADLAQILINWGVCSSCPEDLNQDGIVNGADLAIVLINWTG